MVPPQTLCLTVRPCTRTPEVQGDNAIDGRVECRTGDTRSGRGGGGGKARAVAEPNSASPLRTHTGSDRTRRLAAAVSALGACVRAPLEREQVGHTDLAVEELVLLALVLLLRLRRQRVQCLYNI